MRVRIVLVCRTVITVRIAMAISADTRFSATNLGIAWNVLLASYATPRLKLILTISAIVRSPVSSVYRFLESAHGVQWALPAIPGRVREIRFLCHAR